VIAAAYESLNDRPSALRWLERAHEDSSFWVWFQEIRTDARYLSWARSIGLPEVVPRAEPG
jgi:hypothetical protein